MYAPVGGDIIEVNNRLVTEPGLVNAEPTGNGWMFKMKVAAPAEIKRSVGRRGLQGIDGVCRRR